ncbi:hypothetical protein F3Y22_tig00112234pilonHSYRG00039 [Hibiscus syriacus]|uniref:Pentatricopeptide repeat-containing protein n=1 Tax=Hibiscus syriacus TaxID=106335 RepID=A0A6A2YB08_HIBSY|nr:hypothetical protein F3Y22_tig00112234pilonHSYRG00039 [Hibiscus syriacus]
MPKKIVASWIAMISGYCHNSFGFICILHGYITKGGFLKDSFLQNSLIGAYAKSRILSDAVKLLERLSSRDVVFWISIISGSVLRGSMHEALLVFFRMQEDGVAPNEVIIVSSLHACSFIGQLRILQWVHGLVSKLGWHQHELVLNSIAETKNHLFSLLRKGVSISKKMTLRVPSRSHSTNLSPKINRTFVISSILPIQVERMEASALPIQVERKEASTLPIQVERKEASTLPIQVERKEASVLPIQVEQNEASTLPIQVERKEALALPIQVERKEASTLPIQV